MIQVNQPLLDGNEEKYLAECIKSGWISSEGPFVRRFEAEFSTQVRRRHGVAVCNGTAAIDAAIDALAIGPGDEVILPAFTIISCIAQVIRSGATPVLVDSDPATWNMDVTQVENRITSRTRAIMAVHTYGLPVDMDPLCALAARHGIKLIEDASEMIGQEYRGRPCGSFGDISTVSFYPNKHVTTGEGGMILTDDDELAETCRGLRNLCFRPHERFVHERLGWNLRMTNLQAAVGVAQLERLQSFVARKRRMGARYSEGFADLPGVRLPLASTDYAQNIYWVYGLVLDPSRDIDAKVAMRRLAAKGIGCRPFFAPMHRQPVLQRKGLFEDESYPVAEYLYERGFYIPSGLGLSETEIDQVIEGVRRVLS